MAGGDTIRYMLGQVRYLLKFRQQYEETFSKYPDRKVLDGHIIPALVSRPDFREVLDVGCEWYNLHHARHFRNKRYHTIEIDSELAKYGAWNHVVGSFLDAKDYYEEVQFDVVLINGVFGWGINTPEQLREAAEVLAYLVRREGVVVVGWNRNEEREPSVPVGGLLQGPFKPLDLIGEGSEYLANSETGHTYSFFERGDCGGDSGAG